MSNVIAFTPRPHPAEPEALPPLAALGLRANLEEAAQIALDAADRIIAALDLMDDENPALMSMAARAGQAGQLTEEGGCEATIARAREADPEPEPEPAMQEAAPAEPEVPKSRSLELYPEPIRLPWRGTGNVVSAAGCAVLALMARA